MCNRSIFDREKVLSMGRIRSLLTAVLAFVFLYFACSSMALAQSGSLQVVIEPEGAVDEGAQWRLVGESSWRDANSVASGLEWGTSQVEFKPMDSWEAPETVSELVFAGYDKVTTGTYTQVAHFNINEIPDLLASVEKGVRFYVETPDLTGSVQVTAIASPAPSGSFTTDLTASNGMFQYIPAESDRQPFSVIFTAVQDSPAKVVTQTIQMTPLQNLSAEQAVFGLERDMVVPGAAVDEPLVKVTSRANAERFNLITPANLRTVEITADTIVIESGHANGLYERFNYSGTGNTDIEAMIFNARVLTFRSPMHLPKTNVTINAWELRFEESDGNQGSLDVTPLADTSTPRGAIATDRVPGADGVSGENGGNYTLNIASFYSDPGVSERLISQGAQGQQCGAGRDGAVGFSMPIAATALNHRGVTAAGQFTYYHLETAGYDGNPSWNEVGGVPGIYPTSGEAAVSAGTPGVGGDGGSLHSTLDVSGYSSLAGGAGGDGIVSRTYPTRGTMSYFGGDPGTPRTARAVYIGWEHRAWDTWVLRYNGPYYLNGTDYPTMPGADLEPVGPGPDGTGGAVSTAGNPMAAITSILARRVLNNAKDEYLIGNTDQVSEMLTEYDELINVVIASWDPAVERTQDQIELVQIHHEMQHILNRIGNNLDYFGNPAGWTPMLSLEVTTAMFDQEIDHAINVMYLAYWVKNNGLVLSGRQAALTQLQDKLAAEIESLKLDYEETLPLVDSLATRATAIQRGIEEIQVDIDALELDLRAQAVVNTTIPPWKTALGILGSIVSVLPVGQPAAGAVGGLMELGTTFDPDAPGESAGAAAGIVSKFVKAQYAKSANSAAPKIKVIDSSGGKISTANLMTKEGVVSGLPNLSKYYKVPQDDVEKELNKLKSESPQYNELVARITVLNDDKVKFASDMAAATQKLSEIPNLIANNLLEMQGLQDELDRNVDVFEPRTLEYVEDIDRRVRERLLKYHYYMAKAYEYRLLTPYEGRLDLQDMADSMLTMAQAAGSDPTLSSGDFDQLKTLYREQIRQMADTIYTNYNNNRPSLSAPVRFYLLADELAKINAGDPLMLNLMDIGMFRSTEENVRIVDFSVVEISTHYEGATPQRFATVDLQIEHSGVSNLKSNGEIYKFRHYNANTEQPFVWGARHDVVSDSTDPIAPSAADASLLRSLVSGAAASDMMLYSRPGAWADLKIDKSVSTDTGADIVIDSLRLELTYDFTPKPSTQSDLNLKVVSDGGTLPMFTFDREDNNNRGDAEGGALRVFNKSSAVTLTAQSQYGKYLFQKWIDGTGQELNAQQTKSGIPVVTASDNQLKGDGRHLAAARFDPDFVAMDVEKSDSESKVLSSNTIQLNMDDDLTVKAVYVLAQGSLQVNITPASAVTAGAQWRRAGTTTWYDSGYVESDVTAGDVTVEFKPIAGWETPDSQIGTILNEQTTQMNATYSDASGAKSIWVIK